MKEGACMSKDKNRRKAFVLLPLIALVTIGAVIFGMYLYYNDSIYKPAGGGEKKAVVIKNGTTSDQIVDMLFDQGLVKNKTALNIYLKVNKLGERLKAGKYDLDSNLSPAQIIDRIVRGEVKNDTVRVTIPEGYEVKDIAAVLEKAGLVDKYKFIETAQNGEFDYEFLKNLPDRPVRLEGYLFPDTYEFSKDAAPEQIIKKMLDRFDEVFDESMRKKAADMNLSIDKVVTMASIVEREAKASDERPVVAAVFYNRIKKKMRLESCATIQYALGERKERLFEKDLEIESPYNTYKNNGLPVGPIANPGKASLEAALNPADVDYLFFVLKDSESGTHAFSNNYDDFLKDKQKYIENLN